MSRKPIRRLNVLVALWLNGAAGRDILSGIFRYARAERHWNIRLVQLPCNLSSATSKRLPMESVDGIITSDPQIAKNASANFGTKIPLVLIGANDARQGLECERLSTVSCNDRKVGALAARHFLQLGKFNSFGYFGARRGVQWSDEREAGFREELGRQTARISTFVPAPNADDWNVDGAKVREWLKALPKPAAILTAFDYYGRTLLDACHSASIKVPTQIAVLGVDNDELLCDFTDPPLSSILPDHERAGNTAAAELDALIHHAHRRGRDLTIPLVKIVERESTRRRSPSAHLIRNGLSYIARQACAGITVSDVAAFLGVSTRLLSLRFREIEGRSIHRIIDDERLAAAERMLRRTNQTVGSIASACGYASVKTFEAAFRRRHGCSPRNWQDESSPKATIAPKHRPSAPSERHFHASRKA